MVSRLFNTLIIFCLGLAAGWHLHQSEQVLAWITPIDKSATDNQPDKPALLADKPNHPTPPPLVKRPPEQVRTDIETRLAQDKNNAALHLKMAQWLVTQNQIEDSLVWFIDAKQLSDSREQYESIQALLNQTVETFLADNNDMDSVESFLNQLMQLDPDVDIWYLKKARWHFNHKQYQAAAKLLERLLYNPEFEQIAQALSAKIEAAQHKGQQPTAIKLQSVGHHYIVEVLINGEKAKLLLDTGATLTTLSSESVFAEHLDHYPIRRPSLILETAGGPVESTTYLLPEFSLGAPVTYLEDLEVAVLSMSLPPDVSGLLGMNYLKNFKFQIDDKKNCYSYTPEY